MVPGKPQGFWKRWKSRLQLRLFRHYSKLWPRVVSAPRPDDFGPANSDTIDFLAFNDLSKRVLGLDAAKYKTEQAGIELAHFERVNEVLNQTPEEVADFWKHYWENHPNEHEKAMGEPTLMKTHGMPMTEAQAAERLESLQKRCEAAYKGNTMPQSLPIVDGTYKHGKIRICRGKSSGYCIGREDPDQRRYWTGVVLNLFVPEDSDLGVWSTDSLEVAQDWLERIKNNTVVSTDEKSAMPELPPTAEQRSGETKADQGQESV
jgi:hypothetical protein